MKPRLIIFIKNPEKGKVKTRLAASMGEDMALAIYQELLAHTRTLSLGVDAERDLYYSSFVDDHDNWPADRYRKLAQEGADLGERMENAFRRAFREGAQKVVLIGSDCAALTVEIMERAFEALDEHDFVLGPAKDGGYYLIGMCRMEETLFRHKEWSTDTVLKDSIADIKQMEDTVFLLPTLSDIDREEDLESWDSDLF